MLQKIHKFTITSLHKWQKLPLILLQNVTFIREKTGQTENILKKM